MGRAYGLLAVLMVTTLQCSCGAHTTLWDDGDLSVDEGVAFCANMTRTCAIHRGAVYCWTTNEVEVENSPFVGTIDRPRLIEGLDSNVTALSLGRGGCAVQSGQVWCWGWGPGADTAGSAPWLVPGLPDDAVTVAVGSGHGCASLADGSAMWRGRNDVNGGGQLGDGSDRDSDHPVPVAGLDSGVRRVVAGSYHSAALMEDGEVRSWGTRNWGHVPGFYSGPGPGGRTMDELREEFPHALAREPVQVPGWDAGVAVLRSSASGSNDCAIRDRTLACIGNNSDMFPLLGNVDAGPGSATPVAPTGLPAGTTSFAVGQNHVCAVARGDLYCWGDNRYAQAGGDDGDPSLETARRVAIELPGRVSSLAAGNRHTCARVVSGDIYCWGQISREAEGLSYEPVRVSLP